MSSETGKVRSTPGRGDWKMMNYGKGKKKKTGEKMESKATNKCASGQKVVGLAGGGYLERKIKKKETRMAGGGGGGGRG